MKIKSVLFIFILLNHFNFVIGQEQFSAKLNNIQLDNNNKSENEKLDILYQILFDYQLEVNPENGVFFGQTDR